MRKTLAGCCARAAGRVARQPKATATAKTRRETLMWSFPARVDDRQHTAVPFDEAPDGPGRGEFLLDGPRGPGVHRRHPALFVMSGESFNLDTQEDAAQEGGAQAPQQRGSLKPSILAPT